MPQSEDLPLSGFRAVSIATNLPGPVATVRLAALGMDVLKIEPPSGDLLSMGAKAWYDEVCGASAAVESLDLRASEDRERFDAHLRDADLLITSHRRSGLQRLGITEEALASLNPGLCWVEIVGDTENPDVPGHDLTYQAEVGLVDGTAMPRTVIADMAGADDAVAASLSLLLARERGKAARHAVVGLKQAAERFAQPVRHGLTVDGGVLSGALNAYAIYPLKDGFVACAAIEPHFAMRFAALAGDDPRQFFSGKTVAEVDALAADNDLPLKSFR
ncbi:CoA transferase [Parvularcula lutaonensis]|uniref:CoA transferase n=1 Tax=Parvularcula lutaonensis TaxID=491923 RepID=A0ABV7M8T2_9PROT|nr:CoA transferase [Parvularcula lutaonensis]